MSTTILEPMANFSRSRLEGQGVFDRTIDAVRQVRSWLGPMPDVNREGKQGAFDVVLNSGPGQAYNEEAFRYFLRIEQRRSERSGRPFLMLLLSLKEKGDQRMPVDPAVAAKIFSALWLCLRETDFMGWYRSGEVAGAVLTRIGSAQSADASELIRGRVSDALRESLPSGVFKRFEVHVHQMPFGLKDTI